MVEMKGRAWRPSEVVDQLQAAARQIDGIVNGTPVEKFRPVLVCQETKHPAQVKGLRKVEFRGARYTILLRKCGQALDP